MCLAVPMKVLEVTGKQGDFFNPPVAEVESRGVRMKVRLDIVDRMPEPGDFVVVHAGFAIKTLDSAEADKTMELLKEMASNES